MPRKTIKGEKSIILSGQFDQSRVDWTWEPMPSQTKVLLSPAYEIMSGGSRGGGKRILNSELVLTNEGWKQAGLVTHSDKLVSVDGTYTEILGIYPSDSASIYTVAFDDGASVQCDAEHLWLVYSGTHGKRDGWLVKSTEQILKSKDTWHVPTMSAPAPGEPYDGPDPYVAGQLLGDGTVSSQAPIIYTPDEYTRDYLVEKHNWRSYWYPYRPKVFQMQCPSKRDTDMWLDLLGHHIGADKRIPDVLLRSDPATRLSVLQGLMDSDGSAEKNGNCRFFSISKHLAEQVQYLARSLGGKATMRWVDKKSPKGGTDGYYRVNIVHGGKFNPFRVPRKAQRAVCTLGANRRIVSITKADDGPATCFKVAHPSSLFVVKDFIVTHNTDVGIIFMVKGNQAYGYPEQDTNGNPIPVNISYIYHPRYTGLVIRKNANDHRDWIERAKYIYAPLGGEWAKSEMTFQFESGARIVVGHLAEDDSWEKYRGHEYQRINMEEITQIADEKQYLMLRSSCRSRYEELKCQIFLSTNPIGPGLGWVRNRFVRVNDNRGERIKPDTLFYVEKDLRTEKESVYPVSSDPSEALKLHKKGKLTRVFVPMWLKDNRYLMSDESYIANLMELPPAERAAMLEGDWDAMSGGRYFEEFRERPLSTDQYPEFACHVTDPVELKPWWERWMGCDWGHAHKTAVYWACRNEDDKRIHVYREYVVSGVEPVELGARIAEKCEGDLLGLENQTMVMYLSKDAFDKRQGSTSPSTAEMIASGISEAFGPGGCLIPHLASEEQMDDFWGQGKRLQPRIVLRMVDASSGSRLAAAQYIRSLLRWWPVRTGEGTISFDAEIAEKIRREEGIEKYHKYMQRIHQEMEVLPKLKVWKAIAGQGGCPGIIQELQEIQRDPDNPEDYLDARKGKYDLYDGFRYCLYNHVVAQGAKMPKERWIEEKIRDAVGDSESDWRRILRARQAATAEWDRKFSGGKYVPIPMGHRLRRR